MNDGDSHSTEIGRRMKEERYCIASNGLIVNIKVISLTVALVSVLSLETEMLTQFGDGDVLLRQIIVGSTGAFVYLTVLILRHIWLIKAQKRLKHDLIQI